MKTETTELAEFDISALDAADEGKMTVHVNGQPTTWIWTFAGPGHPKTIEQNNRLARERLREESAMEQARVNGKKWKADTETPDQARARNINLVVERLLGWTPVKLSGEAYPFSEENARALLADPRKGLFAQASEFLASETAFTKASAKS
jgi:hypothetical protein